jgi:hypothetical protein
MIQESAGAAENSIEEEAVPVIDRGQLLEFVQGGASLEAFPEFAGDEEIVRAAVSRNARELMFATDELRDNEKFIASLLPIQPLAWKYASGKIIAMYAMHKKQRDQFRSS